MKLSNFELIKDFTSIVRGTAVAEVDVETGVFFKKRERKTIQREYGGAWFFADNGRWTPGFEAERLERSWRARAEHKQ